MNKQKGISTTLSILLIVLLAVIVGGVVVYKYYLVPKEEPSAGKVPEEVQDETADWETYRNEKYGFEIKYPPDWKVVDGGVNYFGFDKRDFDVCFGLACTAPGIVIELHPNDNIETFWLWEIIQEGELSPTIKVIKKEVVTIRNREITKALLEQGNGWQEWNYLFDSPEIKGFTLFSANTAKRDQIVYDLIAEKMLSTFKFLEKDETADWKTFNNAEFGYSFKYPSTYIVKEYGTGTDVQICESSDTHYIVYFYGQKTSATLSWIIKDRTDGGLLREARPTIINGLSAYEGIVQGIISWYGVLVKNNSNLIEITFDPITDEAILQQDKTTLTNTQKLILSTFKFIE